MFTDPLSTFSNINDTLAAVNLPRIGNAPSRYRLASADEEREVVISHSQSTVKGTGAQRKRVNVAFTLRKKVAASSEGSCCTPGYVEIANASFNFDYTAGTPLTTVQDVVKSLASWMSEANGVQVIDKLYNGES